MNANSFLQRQKRMYSSDQCPHSVCLGPCNLAQLRFNIQNAQWLQLEPRLLSQLQDSSEFSGSETVGFFQVCIGDNNFCQYPQNVIFFIHYFGYDRKMYWRISLGFLHHDGFYHRDMGPNVGIVNYQLCLYDNNNGWSCGFRGTAMNRTWPEIYFLAFTIPYSNTFLVTLKIPR